MKAMKVFLLAAAALAMGLAGCTKENGTVATDGNFEVSLRFKSATATRADGAKAVAGTEVGIDNGWLCFVTNGGSITDVYTIKNTGTTTGKNILNTDLASTVTLSDVPGTSSKAFMVVNPGTGISAPAVGDDMDNHFTGHMQLTDQGNYTRVTATGQGNLTATADPAKKAVTIALGTLVSRIQIEEIKFDSATITDAVVDEIYVNGYYSYMSLDGITAKSTFFTADTDRDAYAPGTGIFPSSLIGYVFDQVTNLMSAGFTITPDNGVWGYNLFTSATPQIVIKLGLVEVNGTALPNAPLFVTVNGFKNTATGTAVDTIEGGMIYTIKAGTLVIKPEHIGVTPGVTPIKVDVDVTPVTWQETEVTPNL